MEGQPILALTAEQLESTSNVRFVTNRERNALVEQLKNAQTRTVAYQELHSAYGILLGIVTSTGISKFEDVADRVLSLFEKEEMFRPTLLSPEGKPVFHQHALDVLQYWYGPEKPFRASPLDTLGMWLYGMDGNDPLLLSIKQERKTRSQQPVFLEVKQGESSGESNSSGKASAERTQAATATQAQVVGEIGNQVGSSSDLRSEENLVSRPVEFGKDQLAAAKQLQASRKRSPDPRKPPYTTEDEQQDSPKPAFEVELDPADAAPELLFDWRRAMWNTAADKQDRVSGDKALNTAYSSTTAKFCENGAGLVITSVHTAFVQVCIRYRLTKVTALSYVSLLYGGTAHVDYLAHLEQSSENGTAVTLDAIFAHMESLYDTRQSRTMAKESLSNLRLDKNGTRVEALATYERSFRKIQAGAGRLSEDTLLHNLQFALRDESVDFADVVSSQISSGQHMTFSNAIAALRAAAANADAKRPRNSASDTFANETFGQNSSKEPRTGPAYAPPFDNRRLSNTFKRWSKFAKGGNKSNPIDRKTGKPMVCRSVGCNSTEHLQYSGRCPVQQRREKQGTARTYMAATIQEDISDGIAVEDILTEILFSQENESADESEDGDSESGGMVGLAESDLLENDESEQNFRLSPAKPGIFGAGLGYWWRS